MISAVAISTKTRQADDRIRCGLVRCRASAMRIGLVAAILLAFGAVIPADAQSGTNGGATVSGSPTGMGGSHSGIDRSGLSSLSNDDDMDPVMAERRMRALNAERQKEMVADANKLLKLAKELNSEVASTNSGAFTPDQLRKIAEIEKLAKNVRERMTSGTGETPSLLPPPTVVYPVH
jgi:hypothetical protein